MGLYLDHVVPRIVNRQCGQARSAVTRDPATLIAQAGFLVERTAQGLVRGPTLTSWLTCGRAGVRPA